MNQKSSHLALRLTDVTKSYQTSRGTKVGLHPLTLDLTSGSLTALVGRSGCGKTTALNIVSGLIESTAGTVTILDQDISKMSGDALRKFRLKTLGRVFQHFDLFDELTVFENVMLPSEFSGVPEKEARETAEAQIHALGLGDIIHERSANISGGEKQRTAIARAMSMKLPILLADEPTGNLDKANAEAVGAALVTASKAGVCVLVATHDPIVKDVCDVVIDLDARNELLQLDSA
jgi:putative ABC transport system ATP-binding protein